MSRARRGLQGGPFIRTVFPRALVIVARMAGLDVDALIAQFRLPPDVESRAEVEIPIGVLRALGDEVALKLGAPDLALNLAAAVQRGQFGLFEFILRSAPTLGEACRLGVTSYYLCSNYCSPYAVSYFAQDGTCACNNPPQKYDQVARRKSCAEPGTCTNSSYANGCVYWH